MNIGKMGLMVFSGVLLISGCSSGSIKGDASGTTQDEGQAGVDPRSHLAPSDPNPASNPNACSSLSAQVGEPCTLGDNSQGVYGCSAGALQCRVCAPGQTREAACPCGMKRHDVCSQAGAWQTGACALCAPVVRCSATDGCRPGDIQYRRCDNCTGANCAGSCLGQKWVCTTACDWQPSSGACQAMSPQCIGDVLKTESCGKCGSHQVACDGCFWSSTPCQNSGVCQPGDTHEVPCSVDPNIDTPLLCGAGATSVEHCNGQCQWDAPTACSLSCADGDVRTVDAPCGQVSPGTCGTAKVQQVCIKNEVTTCGSTTIQKNGWVNNPNGPNDVSQCTTNCGGSVGGGCNDPCAAGTTKAQSCAYACGLAGTQQLTCNPNGCGWTGGACQPQDTTACHPDAVQTLEVCAQCPTRHHQKICGQGCQWQDVPCVACQ